MNNADREAWEHLPSIYVRLHKDPLGYPPKKWEQLKAELTTQPGIYRLKSIPLYARGLALEDEIATGSSPEGYSPVFTSVTKRSGFSTMRLSIAETEGRHEIVQYFNERGVLLEFDGSLVALAIPRDVFDQVSEYICDQKTRGRWDAEDGYLVTDEPNA